MSSLPFETAFTRQVGIKYPIICGAMYPCSNPELVAAASDAGAIGIVQPVSMTYVYGHDFREGLRLIKSKTSRPFGMNALIEQSSKLYRQRVEKWIDVALEEGVRFFVTSLGNPRGGFSTGLHSLSRRAYKRFDADWYPTLPNVESASTAGSYSRDIECIVEDF